MAKSSIKIRAKIKKGACEVKALIKHPMETGQRKNQKTGNKIPAHFIQEVTCTHNGEPVLTTEWGVGVSTNPYLSFYIDGASKGDSVTLNWADNMGGTDSITAKVK